MIQRLATMLLANNVLLAVLTEIVFKTEGMDRDAVRDHLTALVQIAREEGGLDGANLKLYDDLIESFIAQCEGTGGSSPGGPGWVPKIVE